MENYIEKIQEAKKLYDDGKKDAAFDICFEIVESENASDSAQQEAMLLICLWSIQDLSMEDFDDGMDGLSFISKSACLAFELTDDPEVEDHVLDVIFDTLSSHITTIVDKFLSTMQKAEDITKISHAKTQLSDFSIALLHTAKESHKYHTCLKISERTIDIIDEVNTLLLDHFKPQFKAFADMLDDSFRIFYVDAPECLNRLAIAETLLITYSSSKEKILRNKWYVNLLCMKLQAIVVNDGQVNYLWPKNEHRQKDIQLIQELVAEIQEVEQDYVPPSYDVPQLPSNSANNAGGCYVATCVYGSYDCPEVWTLRRFRDHTLGSTWYGRAFIHTYYAVSPTLVKWFGKTTWFKKMWKGTLDRMVHNLQENGVADTPYEDKHW